MDQRLGPPPDQPPPRGKWPVLAWVAMQKWPTVLKFALIGFVIQLPAAASVLVYILLHR
jgi:hypothetical protein